MYEAMLKGLRSCELGALGTCREKPLIKSTSTEGVVIDGGPDRGKGAPKN